MSAVTPFANILHREALRRLVDDRTFERGQDYHAQGRVGVVSRHEASLSATVRGSTHYRVRLWVNDSGLAYSCSCPIGADGAFCKHGVAVGLAWLGQEGGADRPEQAVDLRGLRGELGALAAPELLEIVLAEAAVSPAFRERLARRRPR